MRQFSTGYEDYTLERDEILKNITLEEIEKELGAMR
jgi:hypothetical protein